MYNPTYSNFKEDFANKEKMQGYMRSRRVQIYSQHTICKIM